MRATYFWNLKGSWRRNTSLCQKDIFLSPFRTTNDALFTEKLSILSQDFHSPTKSCVLWHCRWCLQGTHLTWKFVGWLRLLWMVKQSFVLPCLRFAFLDGRTMPSRTIVCTCSVFFTWFVPSLLLLLLIVIICERLGMLDSQGQVGGNVVYARWPVSWQTSATVASVVCAVHTGAFMLMCSFTTSIVYSTIVTALKKDVH